MDRLLRTICSQMEMVTADFMILLYLFALPRLIIMTAALTMQFLPSLELFGNWSWVQRVLFSLFYGCHQITLLLWIWLNLSSRSLKDSFSRLGRTRSTTHPNIFKHSFVNSCSISITFFWYYLHYPSHYNFHLYSKFPKTTPGCRTSLRSNYPSFIWDPETNTAGASA